MSVAETEVPSGNGRTGRPVLEVQGLVKHYDVRSTGFLRRRIGDVHAVCGVDLELWPGETLGIVGESGCGKTTLSRTILKLTPPTAGAVVFQGNDLASASKREMRRVRQDLQIVFQDPFASLDPRMTVQQIIAEPLKIHSRYGAGGPARVIELLELVGLDARHATRYPHEFSGGQRQRIGIARALALEPRVIVLDEPVSALDVSIQAGVLNLLEEIQNRLSLAYIFVAHDLSVVRHISDQVAVMYLGRVVEIAPADELHTAPAHPYTQALLSAVPIPDPRLERNRIRIVLEGDVPSPVNPPSGCRFRTRCWKKQQLDKAGTDTSICEGEVPELIERGQGHPVACHFAEDLQLI